MSRNPENRAASPVGLDWELAATGGAVGGAVAVASVFWWHGSWSRGSELVVLGILIGAAVSYALARPLKRDLARLGLVAALLARGQWDAALGDHEPEAARSGEVRYVITELRTMAIGLRAQVDALQRGAEERAALAERARHVAVLEERQRLARELHDTVSQELFGLAMILGSIRRSLGDARDAALVERLTQAEAGAQRAQVTMRGLIRALRPIELGTQDLESALKMLLDEVSERHHIATSLTVDGALVLSPGVEDALFRVAQEAASNAVRHAEAKTLAIRLLRAAPRVELEVADDGVGFDPAATQGHVGLHSMRERAEDVGGHLFVRSLVGRGTTVVLWVPVTGPLGEDLDDGPTGP